MNTEGLILIHRKKNPMKLKFQLFLFAVLLLAGYKGYSQCSAAFTSYNYGAGSISFQTTAYADTGYTAGRYYLWLFGDGSTDSTVVGYDSHTYSASGTFIACLTVVDPGIGCNVQACDTVAVNLCADNVNFYSSLIGFGDDTFIVNIPGGGSGFTAEWNFGDGSGNYVGLTTSHQYTTNGNFNVCVAINGSGCADTICQQNSVSLCQSYNPDFAFTLLSSNPYIGIFTPIQPNPSSYTYGWLFAPNAWTDGDTIFYPLGNTSVTMLVTSPTGCVDSVTKSFNLDWCGLQPSAYESSNGYLADFAAIVADTTTPGTTYSWSFPGASPSSATGEYASTNYSAYGNYTASVIISAQGGCTDTLYESVTITPGVYSIAGQISGGTAQGNATVYLVIQDSVGHLALADSFVVQLIDTGAFNGASYTFNNLAADTYYVKAALQPGCTGYADYLPTYYTSSLSWSTAAPVAITYSSVGGINITLTPGNNPGGPGFVSGYVSQGAGIVVHGNTGAEGPRGVGDALAGVQINLLTSADEPVAYTYTDANGDYRFNNLAYGGYKIYAEQLNKYPVPVPFTLSASDSGVQVNLDINSDSTYSAINNISNISLQGIYPNPVVNKLEIQLSSKQNSGVTVKLTDALGRVVASEEAHLTTGANNLEMDMENMAAGVYQLLIQTNDQHLTYKVVKAK